MDKPYVVDVAKKFREAGFKIVATGTTYALLRENGIECEKILKMQEGRPNIVDAIVNKKIQLIVNTPSRKESIFDDSYIRKNAIKHKVPYITTIAAASASADGILAAQSEARIDVNSLQKLHEGIKR